jgi:hypothetical protein
MSLGTAQPGPEQDVDALVAEQLEDRRRDIGVFARGELRALLDDGHPRAEPPHGLCQFEPDVAAAHDNQVPGQPVQVEELDVSHRPGRGQAGQVGHCRVGAQVQEDAVAADPAGTAAGQFHLDGPRLGEAGVAHDEFGPAGPVPVQVQPAQAVDHDALPVLDALHAGGGRPRFDSEFGGPPGQGAHLGGVDDVLARQAGDVRARPADQLPLHHRRALPFPRHGPGQVLACLAAADHQDVVVLDLSHLPCSLPCGIR